MEQSFHSGMRVQVQGQPSQYEVVATRRGADNSTLVECKLLNVSFTMLFCFPISKVQALRPNPDRDKQGVKLPNEE